MYTCIARKGVCDILSFVQELDISEWIGIDQNRYDDMDFHQVDVISGYGICHLKNNTLATPSPP